MATVGDRIRRLREQRLLTQRELAERAGIGPVTLHRIESGKVVPRLRTLRRLAEALGIPPEALAPHNRASEQDKQTEETQ